MIFHLLLVLSATPSVPGTSSAAIEWLQDELPAAEAVLDARDAGFSEQATRQALASILMEGRVRIDGLEGTGSFLERYGPGGVSWFELRVPGLGNFEQGFDGERSWDRDPRRGARFSSPSAERQAIVRHGLQVGRPWRELYSHVRTVSKETIEGAELLRIEARAGEMSPEWLYVDPATNQLVRHVTQRETPDGTIDVITTYSDFRPIEGVPIAHRRVTRTGAQSVERELEKVRFAHAFEKGTFDLPKSLQAYLRVEKEARKDPWPVEMSGQKVLATRASCSPQEFGQLKGQMRVALAKHLEKHGRQRTGPFYVRYLGFGPDRIDFESGVYIDEPLPDTQSLATLDLPKGPALSAWHEGDYDTLPILYTNLESVLTRDGLRRSSGHIELFWVDELLDPDPAQWRTQILVPVHPPEAEGEKDRGDGR